jgi:hypothetical protein
MVSFRNQMRYNHNISRCLTRQHDATTSPPRPSLGFLSDLPVNAASPADADRWGELADDCFRDNDPAPPVIVTGPLSENPEEPSCFHGNYEIAPQQSSDHEYHMNTPFTTISSIIKMSRWQKRSSCYKNDHVQQKKGRRQRNRIAITLLTISLPPELRRSSIRPLNEEIRRLGWWENRESLNEYQRTQLGLYREIQKEWQELLKA